ncbi:unnamed protein product, partial [Brachionus calyciflorus]
MPRKSKNSITNNFQNTSLTLDKPCYYAGELINGNVSFELSNRIYTSNLRLKILGYAKIRWNNKGSIKKTHEKLENDYKAQETIIENEVILMSRSGDKSLYLENGRHSYSFQIPLNHSLPPSYEHPYGKICYKILFETGESGSREKLCEKTFTVLSILDLNNFRYLKQPNSVKIDKNVKKCCGLRKGGDVTVTLNTLQGAYVPGQSIPFGLVIKNDSSKDIKKFFVYLLQETHIQANSSLRVVSKFEFPKKILKKTTEVYKNGLLTLPPICQTFNHNLIKVNYFLLVSVNKKIKDKIKKVKNDTLTIPMTIGNKPFKEDEASIRFASFKQCIFGNNMVAKNISTVPK